MNVETKSNSIKEQVKNLELPKGSSLELLSNGSPDVLWYEHIFNSQKIGQIDVHIFEDHIDLLDRNAVPEIEQFSTKDQIEDAVADIKKRVKSRHDWAMHTDNL